MVLGPGVGETTYDIWDTDYRNRKKFEILEVISEEGQQENPTQKYHTMKTKYNMYKLKLQWIDSGEVSDHIMRFEFLRVNGAAGD